MSDNHWTVEIMNTDYGPLRGSWIVQGQWVTRFAALNQAKRLTTSCDCGDRVSYVPENVRVREWAPVDVITLDNVPDVPHDETPA